MSLSTAGCDGCEAASRPRHDAAAAPEASVLALTGSDLGSRVAIVTGAGAGIGRGVAIALARAGCAAVLLNDLPCAQASLEETAAALRSLGCMASLALADVSDAEAVNAAVAQAVCEYGKLDIVVANAAWSDRKPLVEQGSEVIRRVIEVTQVGTLNTVKAGAAQMRAQALAEGCGSRGKIVIISSIMGDLVISKESAAYSMSKAAVTHLGRCLASELVEDRINVNVVCPGWIDTPGERKFNSDETIAKLGRQLPWGRLGTADDVGRTVAFLCSSGADYITGSALNVDGGYTVSTRLPFGSA